MPGATDDIAEAAGRRHQPHAAVAADIVEAADLAGPVAQHDERPAREIDRHGIARVRQLGADRDRSPGAREQLLPFELVEIGAVGAARKPDGGTRGPAKGLDGRAVQEVLEPWLMHGSGPPFSTAGSVSCGMVPVDGFEPPTHALRMRCSAN